MADEVLEEVSTCLRDTVGRYDAEEFLTILNGCAGDDLNTRAEQVRKAISGYPFPMMSGPNSVSLSVRAITN